MKKLFLLTALIPCLMGASLNHLKKELEQENKEILIMLDRVGLSYLELVYYIGRSQAFFDVIYMIEEMKEAENIGTVKLNHG